MPSDPQGTMLKEIDQWDFAISTTLPLLPDMRSTSIQ
jgi:hypothetical protein